MENTHITTGYITVKVGSQIVKFDPEPFAKFLADNFEQLNIIKSSIMEGVVGLANSAANHDTDVNSLQNDITSLRDLHYILSIYDHTEIYNQKGGE